MTQVTLICFIFIFTVDNFAEIIDAARRTVWNPGISEGITEISGPLENAVLHGADPTGKIDSKDAIVKAINALPANGGVVLLPTGTYLIKSTITIGKNGVVIRGDGVEKTRLLHDHTGLCFDIVTYKRGIWQKLQRGYTKGSQTIVVEDGSKFSIGAFAECRQANDSLLMYTSPEWIQDWGDSAVGQLFEVTGINGNDVTFRTPLHFDFRSELSPQIRPQGFVTGVGFEKFRIERLQTGNSTFQFKNSAYCWVRNIESYHTQKSHVTNNTTLGCVYRDSYFHRSFSYGGGGCGYGIEFGSHCTDGLVENNIFDSLRHAMMIHIGTSGTVFGYNYSINPVQGEGETALNVGWVPPDISLHGHYAQMNLFEGNVVQEIGVSDHWGPMGPGNTFFRNVVQGEGIFLYDHSHAQNFVGNRSTKWNDDATSRNTLRHGEQINGVVIWDSSLTDHTISSSYYLNRKPVFYGAMEWPSVGVDKPNGTIPAWERWKSGVMVSGARERKDVSNPKPKLILRKAADRHSFFVQINNASNRNPYLVVTDLSGKIAQTQLHHTSKEPDLFKLEFHNKQLGAGIFIIRLYADRTVVCQKLVIP